MLDKIRNYGMEFFGMFYGVYRGKVIRNDDPDNLGQIVVHCPQVHGLVPPNDMWALPKAPFGGSQFGLWAIPDVGDWVYVSFDHGRPEYPIYEGGWWGNGDTTSDMVTSKITLVSKEGMKIVIDRSAKTILVEQSNGNSIKLSATEIDVTSSSTISLSAPIVKVTGNLTVDGELTVSGELALSKGASITGDITMAGALNITGSITLNGLPIG